MLICTVNVQIKGKMRNGHMEKHLEENTKKAGFSSGEMLQSLRDKGAQIGEDVLIYSPSNTMIDSTAPWLLTIGDHVRITEGVKILTHDYAWSVLKHYGDEPGAVIGAQNPGGNW